ncbi:DUF1330 domain-containing protein [Testudinibacter aquarius]|uniref:Uncharacterized protein (DUF1330 family) n=2 Tax=Testudinibacter aquarius TaxID=1524974 RepID=A0A4R3YBV0_9PAST|nr:DUF1330 domain-containing protein [Testudinibacter aquarius]TCV89251.1 uncharacterized protein (DUF1330 family) [Testudinibacter aquarius]
MKKRLIALLFTGLLAATSLAHAAPAYVISEFQLTDADSVKPYRAQMPDTLKAHGGQFLARGGKAERKEGIAPMGGVVIIKFDSPEQAKNWYNSDAYQSIKPIRQRSGNTRSILVEGLDEQAGSISRNGTPHAYYIAEFEPTDSQGMRPYSEKVESLFAPYSGRYIVRGKSAEEVEGFGSQGRMVVIEFDSLQQAQNWYNSPEYAELRKIRWQSGNTRAMIVEGVAQ